MGTRQEPHTERNKWIYLGIITASIIVLIIYALSGTKPSEPSSKGDPLPSTQGTIAKKPLSSFTANPSEQNMTPEQVTKFVEERNRENAERLEGFEVDGWSLVEIDDPPDEELMNLSPSLLEVREEELQEQIQSNSFSREMLSRLSEIALKTKDEKTRYVAIEALGRSGERDAQLLLMGTYDKMDDEDARSQILGYLIPSEPDDEVAIFLQEQISDPALPDRLKEGSAFPLAMMTLLKPAAPGEMANFVSAEMPAEWQKRFSNIVELLERGGQVSDH